MKPRKPSPRQMLSSCADIRDDDGIDPREFFREGRTARTTNRKTLQLCSQVADRLNGLFAESTDDVLQQLLVTAVTPAPDATQLLVTVVPAVAPELPLVRQTVLARLAHASGHLRSEIATAITRKRAPRLVFQLGGGSPGTVSP